MKKVLWLGFILCLLGALVGCGEEQKVQYTLTFYSEGEIVHTLTAEEGQTIALEDVTEKPTRAADEDNTYTFSGWTLGEDGEVTESYTVTADAAFYAKFTAHPIPTHTVRFVVEWEGTRTVLSTQTVKDGKTAQVPAEVPAQEGYTFTSWSPDPAAPVTQDTEYTAEYAVNSYKLVLHTLDGTSEKSYAFGTELVLGEPELPEFLTFAGWYKDEECREQFTTRKMPARELHAYAKCEFDLEDVRLSSGEGMVYGGKNEICVEELPQADGLSYTYLWQYGESESHDAALQLHDAGTYVLSLTLTADYRNTVHGTRTFEETVRVAKKTLTGTVGSVPDSVVYGTSISPTLQTEGVVGEDVLPQASFLYNGEESEGLLPAGSYTVTAQLPEMKNYELGTVKTAHLEVTKKELTAILSAEQTTIVYGQEFEPRLRFEGFVEGETEEVVKKTGEIFRYLKGGAAYSKEHFGAGTYTLDIRSGDLTADNYTIVSRTCELTVQKASLTITVTVEQESYVYGEEPAAHVSHGAFVYEDETEKTVFGAELSVAMPSRTGKHYPVGDYTVTASRTQDTENYQITVEPGHFAVTAKPIQGSIAEATAVYGDPITLPTPTFTGLLEGEEGLAAELAQSVSYTCDGVALVKKGDAYEADRLFTVGAHTIGMTAEPSGNYAPSFTEGSLTVTERSFVVSSGKVVQGREQEYLLEPAFSGADAERFTASGKLVLNTRKAGTYTHTGDTPGEDFSWREALKITHEDADVTNCFAVTYSLDVTLNASSFTLKVPSEGLSFVYDGREHTFTVEASLIEGEPDEIVPEYAYTVNGAEEEGVPSFKDAGKYTVQCTVSAENYEAAQCEFVVEIEKATPTINVDGVKKEFVYTGEQQTVTADGASSDSTEECRFVMENNTFTTVDEGNALVVKISLPEGKNYKYAETTFRIHVAKQTLERLPEGVVVPTIGEQVNMVGKTLNEVTIGDERFEWKDKGEALQFGEHAYKVYYYKDRANIEPFETELTFRTRKQVVTVEAADGEADYVKGASADTVEFVKFTYRDESGETCGDELGQYLKYSFQDGASLLAVGGTYSVQWTLTLQENDYFELQFADTKQNSFHGENVFKWKSVMLDGKLYTVEDALKLLDSGKTATVQFNTSFASKELAERLYQDAAYRTVKANATLLVPFSATDKGVTTQQTASVSYVAVSSTGYVTLTLPAGELIVNGKLIVNANRASVGTSTSSVRGSEYGSLSLAKDAKVTVKSGATFESMGFTYGEGEVFAESGASVFEPLAMPGWKGGKISTGIYTITFPLNQYTTSSIIAKIHIQAGATYSLRADVSASIGSFTLPQSGLMNFVGKSNALMILTKGEVVKYVTEQDGRVHFDIAGEVGFGNISLQTGFGSASTSGTQIPIPGHFSFDLQSGSYKIPDKVALKLLPGAQFTVDTGASLTIENGGGLFAYGSGNYTMDNSLAQWRDGQLPQNSGYPNANMPGCYRTKPKFDYSATTAAQVLVKGELTVADGAKFGATVGGAENAKLNIGASVVLQNEIKEDFNGSGSTSSFFTTTFTCGDLTAGNYNYRGGNWVKEA